MLKKAMLRTFLAVLFIALSLSPPLPAQVGLESDGVDQAPQGEFSKEADAVYDPRLLIKAELLAGQSAIIPGKPLMVAVQLQIVKNWHIYWSNPGDSGQPPSIDWQLPEGWKAGPIRWPVPTLHKEPGDMIVYGYDDSVTFLVELTPPATIPAGEITLKANMEWLVCKAMYIPSPLEEMQQSALSLPSRGLSGCIPSGTKLEITLPVADAADVATTPANPELFAAAEASLPKTGEPPYTLRWEPKDTEVFLKVEGLPEGAELEFFPGNHLPQRPTVTAPGTIRLFYPQPPETPEVHGLLVVKDPATGERSGWYISHSGKSSDQSAAASATSTGGFDTAAAGSITLPRALILGFLGGFILNLMPCVLPVIALKIFGFIGQAGQSRAKVFRMGLAFTAGIFTWFLLIATVGAGLRLAGHEVAWAFQFQNATFVYSMMVLVFVFSLNLLGVFEIWIPGTNKLVNLSGKEGYGGAFLHGAFATILATPCTGPILGPALPFAFTQPIPVTYAMFTAIAAGMALPYVLLTAQPAWMRFLPKPGDWMVRLKQFMGFLLLGTVAWLLGVYNSLGGKDAGINAVWILLGIGTMCWIFGMWVTPVARMRHRLIALAGMGLVFYVALFFARPNPLADWTEWSPARVSELQAEGKPIFVDFTADWCTNCKYNERFVLATEPVEKALAGFVTLKADYTKRDSVIAAELKKHGRSGVPVYLVYPKGGGEPEILPEILTRGIVLDALERAKR